MDKEQIIEILLKPKTFYMISCTCKGNCNCSETFEANRKADEILALREKKESHRPNCITSVYGRTEDPAKCICHSWQRTGDEPI